MVRDDRHRTDRADGLIFALANLWAHLRHPRLALTSAVRLRRLVDFARPRTYGELIQWRKVFDRNPAFATYADKLAAKSWAAQICPDLPTATVLWQGARLADLPQALLTPGHVIKTNNSSGRVYQPHRGLWPREVLARRVARWLRSRRARLGEWAYGEVEPKLFVERLVGEGRPVIDLTFRAFDGRVPLAFVATGWKTGLARAAYFDHTGRRLPLPVDGAETLPLDFALPAGVFARALRYAEQLSRGTDHIRVDFLIDREDVYFGEVTLYTASGYGDEDRLGLGAMLVDHWLAAIETSDFLENERPWPLSLYQAAFRRWISGRRALATLVASGLSEG